MHEPAVEPERPSRWASDIQVPEWQSTVKQLEDEKRSLNVSQIWFEVKTDHSQLEEYLQQANAIGFAAENLQGAERTTFFEAKRTEFFALSESIRLAKAGRLERECKMTLLEPVKSVLAQLQAFIWPIKLIRRRQLSTSPIVRVYIK